MVRASLGRSAGAAVMALGTLTLSVGCASSASTPATASSGPPSTTTSPKTSTAPSKPSTAPTTVASPAPPPPTAARSTVISFDFVDASRPTVSRGQTVAESRSFPTAVYLPASATGTPQGASLPWLVFLHGYNAVPADYDPLLRRWAAAGIVVVAPTLPLTSSESGALLFEEDMVNEPADVSFLIDELLRRNAAESGPLAGRLDPKRIGVAGHSDGANVAYSAGYSQELGDPRITAVIDLSGELPIGMGPFDHATSSPPLLMIVGDQDANIRVAQSQELFDALSVPTWWVELLGAPHMSPFSESNAWSSVVDEVTVAFLHRVLGRYSVSEEAVNAAAVVPDVSDLRGKP